MSYQVVDEDDPAVSRRVPASKKYKDMDLEDLMKIPNPTVEVLRILVSKIYRCIYYPGSSKVSGSWDLPSKPHDWPEGVPFANPNSGSKDGSGKRTKPNQRELEQMYKFLLGKYKDLKESEAQTRMSTGTEQMVRDAEWLRSALTRRLATMNDLFQRKDIPNFLQHTTPIRKVELRQMGRPPCTSRQERNQSRPSSNAVSSSSAWDYDNSDDYLTCPQMVHPISTEEGQVQPPMEADCNAMETDGLEEDACGEPNTNIALPACSQPVPVHPDTAEEDLAGHSDMVDAIMAESGDDMLSYLTSQKDLFNKFNEFKVELRLSGDEDESTTSKTTVQKGQVVQLPPKGDCPTAMETKDTPLQQFDSGQQEDMDQSDDRPSYVTNIPLSVSKYNAPDARAAASNGPVASLGAVSSGIGSVSAGGGHVPSSNGLGSVLDWNAPISSQDSHVQAGIDKFHSHNAPSSSGFESGSAGNDDLLNLSGSSLSVFGSVSSGNGCPRRQNGPSSNTFGSVSSAGNGRLISHNVPSFVGAFSVGSGQNDPAFSGNGPIPNQNGPIPNQNGLMPNQNGPIPNQNGHIPKKNGLMPGGSSLNTKFDWELSFPWQ